MVDALSILRDIVFNKVANYLWKVISPILFVIGVGGNAGIMIILYKMKFWTKMTYVFLFILAVDGQLH
jgi:hypothetical protein